MTEDNADPCLDVVDHDLQLGQLDLNDLRVAEDGFERVQCLVRPLDPDEELVEGVLELAEPEERVLQLLHAVVDALVEVVPAAVELAQGLHDGAALTRRSALR